MLLTPFSDKKHGTRLAKKMEHPLITKINDLEEQISKMELKQEDGPPRMDPAFMASGGHEAVLHEIDELFSSISIRLRTMQMEILRTTVNNLKEGKVPLRTGNAGDKASKEKETTDEVRLKDLYAKGDTQIADNKAMVSEIKVLNEDTVKLLEKPKAQGLGDGPLDVEETY